MPAGKEGDNPAQRTTFRPPWVKEGPKPAATSNAPWTLNKINRRDSSTSSDNSSIDTNPLAEVQLRKVKQKDPLEDFVEDLPKKNNPLAEVQLRSVVKPKERAPDEESGRKNKILANVQLRKTSIQTKEPQENGAKESLFQKPTLKHVPQKEKSPPKKDYKLHNLPTLQKASERVLKSPPRKPSYNTEESYSSGEEEEDEDEVEVEIDKEVPKKRNALVREASMRKLSQSNIPMPPPQPGMPPPPPMMMGDIPTKPINPKQRARLDKLRSRPKVRPDWNNLLQEIESKKKLKHVVCNDRSSPLLPEAKTPDEHFLYKSEEPNVHNVLLKQIEGGIKLKKVKTNDRSKPMLDGLRKIRRQMTIEEQIQKSISMASIPPEEIAPDEIDEMDDIDKVRDDLQSTKQMLALELRNKEAQERENKRLLARIQNLEAELERERNKNQEKGTTGNSSDEKVTQALRKEVEEARKVSNDLEKKYHQAAEELDSIKMQVDDLKRQNQMLERKLQDGNLGKRMSLADRKHSTVKDDSEEEFEEGTEEESDGEDTPEKQEKRALKEVKKLASKLQSFKNKEDNAKKERIALKDIIKKHQLAIKEEKKKYKQLKKEVDKMAALMKDVDEEEDEDAEEKEEAEEEEAEEEETSDEEEESESESEDESDSEVSQSEDEDAPVDKKKTNLSSRVKRHENRLNALKKGNFLLKTNAERLQDDLNKQKDMTASLQEDLDSVLSELG